MLFFMHAVLPSAAIHSIYSILAILCYQLCMYGIQKLLFSLKVLAEPCQEDFRFRFMLHFLFSLYLRFSFTELVQLINMFNK